VSAKNIAPMEKDKEIVREVHREKVPKVSSGKTTEERPAAEVSIPVIEEHLNVDKKVVEKAKYRIQKTVSQENFSEKVPAIHEKVNIQRVKINKYVDAAPDVRLEGDTTIIPVIEEVVVVEKKLMLVEEIHITKSRDEVHVNVKEKLRKEHVEIKKTE
jgi:uncharacterized protein (TIGR02271 family)